MLHDVTVGIGQGVAGPARLGANPAIAAPAGRGLAHVALPAVGNAQGPVHECFQLHPGPLSDGGNLVEGELSRQDNPFKAHRFEELHFFRGVVVHLRAGNEGDRGEIQLEQTHILDNQTIGPQLKDLPDDLKGLGEFPVRQDGIERHVHPGVIEVRMVDQAGHVRDADPGIGPGTEFRRADIDGICPVIDGGHADFGVACRRQQFERCTIYPRLERDPLAWTDRSRSP